MIKKSHKIKYHRRLSKLWMKIHFNSYCDKKLKEFFSKMPGIDYFLNKLNNY